jgi:hypothetical protein
VLKAKSIAASTGEGRACALNVVEGAFVITADRSTGASNAGDRPFAGMGGKRAGAKIVGEQASAHMGGTGIDARSATKRLNNKYCCTV